MTEREQKKLKEYAEPYLNIGITQDGTPRTVIPVPWERTHHAFNMRTPNLYLSPEDLNDPQIMERLHQFRVLGCYIFTPLEDYSFLATFKTLHDISIGRGERLTDLSFLRELDDWFMLNVEDARLANLDDLVGNATQAKARRTTVCLSLFRCEIDDLSALTGRTAPLSELIVAESAGSKGPLRWKEIPATTFRYYELKE